MDAPAPLPRRTLFKAGGLAVAAAAVPLSPARAAVPLAPARGPARAQAPAPTTVRLTGTAAGIGTYQYHPFTVPAGVNRIDVQIAKQGDAKTGLGIFDPRGAHYATLARPNGFRGIYGEERGEFFLATDAASQSFVPGPIDPGEWTVIVPVFTAQTPTPYVVTVTMSSVPAGRPFALGPEVGTVLARPGWYRGDLHAHTPESSDAWKSGSAMSPAQWADACRWIGLDFLALTDHNVVSQNFDLAASAGQDVLLLAGEEMTNWFHGHATVSGIAPGEWFDWRQRPAGVPIDAAHEGTISQFLQAVRASGAFVSAAHPFAATLAWQFFSEAAASPAARTDSLEVWTGPFQPDDQASVDAWDAMNRQGQHVVANGGSDLHGVRNAEGFAAGTPTTVVHADALSKGAVLAALKAGRSFITRTPSGVELYLSGTLGGQRQIMGGTLYGEPTDVAQFEVLVRRAAGMRLVVLRDGAPVQVVPIGSAEQTVQFASPIGAGGFVRVEVRSAPTLLPATPRASTLDMEALTNPIWLAAGSPPAGTRPDRTQPPAEPGPRRGGTPPTSGAPTGGQRSGATGQGWSPAVASAAAPGDRSLAATGGLPAAGVGGAALVAGALVRRMTHSEFRFRTAAGLTETAPVVLTGEVTAVEADAVVLTRWAPGCCSSDEAISVRVRGLAGARVGQWWEVTGTPDGDELPAETARRLEHAPPRREV